MTRFEVETNELRPGVPLKAYEYNDYGMVGEYKAYWDIRRCVFTFYPVYNPMIANGRKEKFSVSDRLVKIRRPA